MIEALIANDLSVILWASELAQRDLAPESDTHAHLAHIRQRVHESATRLRDIQEHGIESVKHHASRCVLTTSPQQPPEREPKEGAASSRPDNDI
jgi:hypothetical protein